MRQAHVRKSMFLGALFLAVVVTGTSRFTAASEKVFRKVLLSVVWIENSDENAFGSGVVIDKKRRLVATNVHVVGSSEKLVVYFPARNDARLLITARAYYRNRKNSAKLRDRGRRTVARVVARDATRDVALLQLEKHLEMMFHIRKWITAQMKLS